MDMNTRDGLAPSLGSQRNPAAGGERRSSQMQLSLALMPSVSADFNPSPPEVAVASASRTTVSVQPFHLEPRP